MSPEDLALLREAVRSLTNPTIAARLTKLVGKPIHLLESIVPPVASRLIASSSTKAIEAAVVVARKTLTESPSRRSRLFHNVLSTASGAAGGAFGLAALPVEIPISTVLMTRAILEIARAEGEDLSDPESVLSCVQVFAFGAIPDPKGSAESDYFVLRGILAASVTEAARFVAQRGLSIEGSPVLVRFISQVASRFGIVLGQKVAAQAIPIVGALGGATLNYVFSEHFQAIARAHFTIRRLERVYGADVVRAEFERFAKGFKTGQNGQTR